MDMQNMQPQANRPAGAKKLIFIVIGGIALLLVVGFIIFYFAGFGMGGKVTQTYSNNSDQVVVGNNTSMPSNWPSDAPLNYSGAKIVFSGNANPQTGKNGAVVSYTLQGILAKDVADYYKTNLIGNGWTIAGNADIGASIILGAKKDTRTFGVSIIDGGNGMLTVTAGLEL